MPYPHPMDSEDFHAGFASCPAAQEAEMVDGGESIKLDNKDREFFLKMVWGGCSHLDCLDGCNHTEGQQRCERFEQSIVEWFARKRQSRIAPR